MSWNNEEVILCCLSSVRN